MEQPFREHTLVYAGTGRVSHLVDDLDGRSVGFRTALCGVGPAWFGGGWLGTGTQAELEEAVRRHTCKRCLAAWFAFDEKTKGNR